MIHIMKLTFSILALMTVLVSSANCQTFQTEMAELLESSCIGCHDGSTETPLNLESLKHDLGDVSTFRKWETLFDRVSSGEMPPASEERPNPKQLRSSLAALKKDLFSASLKRQQKTGRVPARRLTKLELGNTLKDLFLIKNDVTSGIPDEVDTGSFDTVGANQRISALHMESYLAAADQALGHAIQLGKNPYRNFGDFADSNFAHLNIWHEKPLNLGGSITRKLKDKTGYALFADIDYLTQFTYSAPQPGTYRLSAKVAAYQSKKTVIAKIIVKNVSGSAKVVKSVDLVPEKDQSIVVETFLLPGDKPYLTVDMGSTRLGFNSVFAAGGAKNYKGSGMAIMSQKTEGPIYKTWPPESTRQLLKPVLKGKNSVQISLDKDPMEHVGEIVSKFAPRIFRRNVEPDEIATFVDLAKPALKDDREFQDVLQIPLRSMLTSPQFLMFDGKPGKLDDFALANRLSYFLWKSMPDDELFEIARSGKLSDSKVLRQQTERMLNDPKSNRFIKDFVGQWLWIYKVNATTPDDGLYPEFDELLSEAIPHETELFFGELLKENLSLTNLIDSDFTFLNRRLAEHYRVPNIKGQHFRKVQLPEDSLRGGLLTQAAILKTTANGTTTSPVLRGNFVLTNLLGTPPSPPPPNIGSIEPDTRGKTTIREILKAHRKIQTCNQCHREIDPPGFALESFDPIGGFRRVYRADGGTSNFGGFIVKNRPKRGPKVDSSGTTSDGKKFEGIQDYKQHLISQKETIARHFVSRVIVYATGAEIQFADRPTVKAILDRTKSNDYPVKEIVHEVIQSKLFRHK